MPGYVVHTHFGVAILNQWRFSDDTPFPVTDFDHCNAFFAGCVGPDLGYYPGGFSFIADLAHYVRSADLVRSLIAEASNTVQMAFALGWSSHHLLDATIHPLVNIAAGEYRGGPPLTFCDDPYAHVAIEIGIEGEYFPQWCRFGLPQAACLPKILHEYVSEVFSSVYQIDVMPDAARRTLATWPRWQQFISSLAAGACTDQGKPRTVPWSHVWLRHAISSATNVFARDSKLHAMTHPVRSSEQILNLINAALTELPKQFARHCESGFRWLPNFNLDTGLVEESPTYALTVKTLDQIRRASLREKRRE